MNKDIEIWKKTMKSYNDTPYKDGITPRQAIWKKNKATLWYYPASTKKYRVPVFIVYSLINQPFILDLLPGGSTIEALVKEGYDVYLIDFGKPGLEDKDMSLNDYITAFIQPGIKKALTHSSAEEMTLMGYCLGGTLAAIYASIAEEPIKNLVLFVTPVDFSDPPFFDKWVSELRKKEVSFEKYINEIGVIPASQVESGIRLITSPVYLSPYLSLLLNANDKDYVEKWDRFNNWTKGHIPLAGNAAIQLTKDLIIDNNLIMDRFIIKGRTAKLSNITANLLTVATEGDQLVPPHQIAPIMNAVSSRDKLYHVLSGGHTGTSVKNGKLPDYLHNWLTTRSNKIK